MKLGLSQHMSRKYSHSRRARTCIGLSSFGELDRGHWPEGEEYMRFARLRVEEDI